MADHIGDVDKNSVEVVDKNSVEVVDNATDRFYELKVNGAFAGMLIHELTGTRRVFTHTFIEQGFRGHGMAQELVRRVLDPAHPGSWARHAH